MVGGSNSEIPLLASFFYLFDEAEMGPLFWLEMRMLLHFFGAAVDTVNGVICLIRVEGPLVVFIRSLKLEVSEKLPQG